MRNPQTGAAIDLLCYFFSSRDKLLLCGVGESLSHTSLWGVVQTQRSSRSLRPLLFFFWGGGVLSEVAKKNKHKKKQNKKSREREGNNSNVCLRHAAISASSLSTQSEKWQGTQDTRRLIQHTRDQRTDFTMKDFFVFNLFKTGRENFFFSFFCGKVKREEKKRIMDRCVAEKR